MAAMRTPGDCERRLQAGRNLKSEWRDTRPVVYFYRSRNNVWLSAGERIPEHAFGRPWLKFVDGKLYERGG